MMLPPLSNYHSNKSVSWVNRRRRVVYERERVVRPRINPFDIPRRSVDRQRKENGAASASSICGGIHRTTHTPDLAVEVLFGVEHGAPVDEHVPCYSWTFAIVVADQ
jgi:hypothetical protein